MSFFVTAPVSYGFGSVSSEQAKMEADPSHLNLYASIYRARAAMEEGDGKEYSFKASTRDKILAIYNLDPSALPPRYREHLINGGDVDLPTHEWGAKAALPIIGPETSDGMTDLEEYLLSQLEETDDSTATDDVRIYNRPHDVPAPEDLANAAIASGKSQALVQACSCMSLKIAGIRAQNEVVDVSYLQSIELSQCINQGAEPYYQAKKALGADLNPCRSTWDKYKWWFIGGGAVAGGVWLLKGKK